MSWLVYVRLRTHRETKGHEKDIERASMLLSDSHQYVGWCGVIAKENFVVSVLC